MKEKKEKRRNESIKENSGSEDIHVASVLVVFFTHILCIAPV